MKPKFKIGDILINSRCPEELAEVVDIKDSCYYIHPLTEKKYRTIEWNIENFEKMKEVSIKKMPNDILKELCSK